MALAYITVTLGIMMPTNLFTYATTDLNYVESIDSTVDTPEIQLDAFNKSELIVETEVELPKKVYCVSTPEPVRLLSLNDENHKAESRIAEPDITYVDQTDALLETQVPDANYTGCIVELTPEDRDLLERLVQGEAGGEGYEGAALVAQAIRDAIVYRGYNSVDEVRTALKYSGSIENPPNDSVKQAVAYIFDEGGIAVKHKIYYFYAPRWCEGKFHETQKFIIEHKGHRFFSTY